jgi:hypothetical protein
VTLRSVAWDDPALSILGAFDVRATPEGLRFRRLPAWTEAQIPDPALELMARMTSGVRLAFRTNAAQIELDVLETGLQLERETRRAAAFDLVVEGRLVARHIAARGPTLAIDMSKAPPGVRLLAGEPSTIRFSDLPAGEKRVEIWLPQSAMVEVRGLRLEAGATLTPSTGDRRRWAHHGSSISHGMEAAGPSATWPATAAQRAGVELTSLGFAGQCHLDGFVGRVLRDADVDLISLKLGINVVNLDSMRERAFVPATHGLLDTIREAKPDAPILIISPIVCPIVEDQPGPTLRDGAGFRVVARAAELGVGALSLRRIREILAAIVARRRAAGDANLHYLDGLQLFGEADVAALPDGLHPDAGGQDRMGQRFAALAFGPGGAFAGS